MRVPPPGILFLCTWLFSHIRQMHPYHTLLAFLDVFAMSTVTMETRLATTLVRSNGINTICMWTALVFFWGAFIQILTVSRWASITRFAFTLETSGSISTHGKIVFFTKSLKGLKKILILLKITFTTWTQCIEGGLIFVLVLMACKVQWQISLLKIVNTEGREISRPLSSRTFTYF